MIKSLTTEDTIEIISHEYADVSDIKKLGCCGKNRAYQYMKEIKKHIEEKGLNITHPRGKIKMDYVMEFFGIDVNKLYKKTIIGGKLYGTK